jgi:hypothetical protein
MILTPGAPEIYHLWTGLERGLDQGRKGESAVRYQARRYDHWGHGQTNSAQSFLVRSTPVSRPAGGTGDGLLSAMSGPMHRSKIASYSITSSASESRLSEIFSPRNLAVLTLITNSNLVDCVTGKSAGLVPLSTRPV